MTTGMILQSISHGAMTLFAGYMVHQTRDPAERMRRIWALSLIVLLFVLGAWLD